MGVFLFLDRDSTFKPVKCFFCPKMAKRGVS
jgi:hypothetical protein